MTVIAWDANNDRTLLLQLLALHPISISTAEWEMIAQKWNTGNKKDAYRRRFAQIKLEGEALMGNKVDGKVVVTEIAKDEAKTSLILLKSS